MYLKFEIHVRKYISNTNPAKYLYFILKYNLTDHANTPKKLSPKFITRTSTTSRQTACYYVTR